MWDQSTHIVVVAARSGLNERLVKQRVLALPQGSMTKDKPSAVSLAGLSNNALRVCNCTKLSSSTQHAGYQRHCIAVSTLETLYGEPKSFYGDTPTVQRRADAAMPCQICAGCIKRKVHYHFKSQQKCLPTTTHHPFRNRFDNIYTHKFAAPETIESSSRCRYAADQ